MGKIKASLDCLGAEPTTQHLFIKFPEEVRKGNGAAWQWDSRREGLGVPSHGEGRKLGRRELAGFTPCMFN